MLGYVPESYALTKGWFVSIFQNSVDACHILKGHWLKDNTPSFNAKYTKLATQLIQVKLPGLPPEVWSEEIFELIENAIGIYIKADHSFWESGIMIVARILVELNLHDDLWDEMVICKGGF